MTGDAKQAELKRRRLYGVKWALGFLAVVFSLFCLSLCDISTKPNRNPPVPNPNSDVSKQPKQ
jgi:hypothetical protein